MTALRPGARRAALLIAALGWFAVLAELWLVADTRGVPLAWAAWRLADYFTNIANLGVAIVFTGIAFGHRRAASHRLIGSAMLSIILVGLVYNLLLRAGHRAHLGPGRLWNDNLLHVVMPLAVPAFWLGYVPKGVFRRFEPVTWSLFPIVYLAYALARGMWTGMYPYPFLNLARIGWALTVMNVLVISIGFIAIGYLIVWLDGRLAGPRDQLPAS